MLSHRALGRYRGDARAVPYIKPWLFRKMPTNGRQSAGQVDGGTPSGTGAAGSTADERHRPARCAPRRQRPPFPGCRPRSTPSSSDRPQEARTAQSRGLTVGVERDGAGPLRAAARSARPRRRWGRGSQGRLARGPTRTVEGLARPRSRGGPPGRPGARIPRLETETLEQKSERPSKAQSGGAYPLEVDQTGRFRNWLRENGEGVREMVRAGYAR